MWHINKEVETGKRHGGQSFQQMGFQKEGIEGIGEKLFSKKRKSSENSAIEKRYKSSDEKHILNTEQMYVWHRTLHINGSCAVDISSLSFPVTPSSCPSLFLSRNSS